MASTKLSEINIVLIKAVLLRLAVLILIVALSQYLSAYGFIGGNRDYDDYRYEEGAVQYAKTADGLIDVETFGAVYKALGDPVGRDMARNFLDSTPLWYWICCILVYITRWRWSIRILNILFTTLSVYYIYRLAQYIYGERTALLSAKLMAFLPYPVVFSCFSYKDCMVMFCTFYLWYFVTKRKKERRSSIPELILALVCVASVFLTRSGVSVLLVFTLFVYYYFDRDIFERVRQQLATPKGVAVALVVAAVAVLLMVRFGGTILYKFRVYITSEESQENLRAGRLVKISGLRDIWKLPFTLAAAVVLPIRVGAEPTTWCNVISSLNIIMCPIAVGWLLYFFMRKSDAVSFWCMAGYYTVCAVASILAFRQLYSLMPIPVMAFSDYILRNKEKKKTLWMLGSAAMIVGIVALSLLR